MKRHGTWVLAVVVCTSWLAGTAVWLAMQETPTGWVRGTAVAEETGRPLPGVRINLHMRTPQPGERSDHSLRTREDGTFGPARLPAGMYEVQATSQAHVLRRAEVLIEEGKTAERDLEFSPLPPFFRLQVNQHVFTPEETPTVMSHGFVPGDSLAFTIYRVDPKRLFEDSAGNLRQMLYSEAPPEHMTLEGNPGLTRWRESHQAISGRDAEGVHHQRFRLPMREPGLYVVVVRADSLQQVSWVMITRLGLIVKQWPGHALAYVSDIRSGRPVTGATVAFAPRDGRTVTGVTDDDGCFEAPFPPAMASPGNYQGETLFARAEKDGSLAFLNNYYWTSPGGNQDRVYTYTDRPVYRPGHDVHFKGVARRYTESGYRVLAGTQVEVRIADPRDTLVHKAVLTTNEHGSYHGHFRLNEEAATGFYRLVSTIDGREHESGLKVAEYRKPEYSVDVATDKKRYTKGDRIKAKVSAQYYFGAPVAGAEVRYLVRKSTYWYFPREDDAEEPGGDDSGEYYGDYGEVVSEGTTRTDEQGRASISVSTRPAVTLSTKDAPDEDLPEDERYTVEVTVTDESHKEVTAQASAPVTQGDFALSLQPTSYISTPGSRAEVAVEAKDYDGRPVAGARVSLRVQPEVWDGKELHSETESEGTVATDARGKALFRFRPRSQGSYRIEAGARDRRGNRIREFTYLWVTSSDVSDMQTAYPDLEIITDKKSYTRGDTAVVLINTKKSGATALLTIEGPRLYERRLLELQGKTTRVTLPVKREYAPNFFIAVAFVKDKTFASEQKRVKVSVEERHLQIRVKSLKSRYRPGEEARYEIETRDWRGRPVSAELSVGVVDEAVYAVEEDATPPMVGFFYPPRENAVSTAYSFPQIYLDASKEAAAISVRRKFPDTAYWNPTLVTDARGRAEVSFRMPDSLTTWRATVRGATLDTTVGEATARAKTSKDLLVRLVAPRFLTQRDELTISALAHNYTRSEQALKTWLSAPGLSVAGAGRQERFSLRPDEVRGTDWQVRVPTAGEKELTVYLKAASGASDAMALTLPAVPHGRARTEWRRGSVTARTVERFAVRRDAVQNASELRIRLAPSIAAVILGALDYLATYPYGCTEQTMSAFLPDVIVSRTLTELELPAPELERKLPDMVQKGLFRLYSLQHDDGGWGWWRYDASDPWMTAYVVFGLATAKQNGFVINENALNKGMDWLTRQARSVPHPRTNERLYQLYVLTLAGKGDVAREQVTRYFRELHSLNGHATALLTAALQADGRTAEARVAADALWRRSSETQSLIHWPGWGEWGRAGEMETTALALKALLALDPTDPRIAKVVRWMTLNRDGNHWVSTRDTAFALFALTDFLRHSRELQPDYEATVAVNGRVVLTRHVSRKDLFSPEIEIEVGGASLRPGENRVEVTKRGAGNLYYTAVLKQYVAQEDIAPLTAGAGIRVERQYFALTRQRNPRTGVITTAPATRPTTEFRLGQPVLVRVTVRSAKEYEFVIIEDPLPAGCEVAEQGDLEPWEWDRWWSDMEVRDEKVAVFARRLPAGRSMVEYHLRPQIPGRYHVMPTEVYSMYNTELRGSGAETRVRLR